MKNILTEASGSLTSSYLIKSIQEANFRAIASDINPECFGRYIADDFMLMPKKSDPHLWMKKEQLLKQHKVDVVIPSLDESLIGWADRANNFNKQGIIVILSEPETVRIFQDKWLTYQFFESVGIPTPKTSLEQLYPLVKPRNGRGSTGVEITNRSVCMDGMISQEVVEGEEFTVDVLCNNQGDPVYIVPRKRIGVKEGKSTAGIVVRNETIEMWVRKICDAAHFRGPINVQCFLCKDGTVKFIEINPRIAGGMALGFAATENWIGVMINHFVFGKEIVPKEIQYGMRMMRYYAEVFIPES